MQFAAVASREKRGEDSKYLGTAADCRPTRLEVL